MSKQVVYFVRLAPEGPVKIGQTSDLARRIATLQTTTAEELVVLRTIAGGVHSERWLHQHFTSQHIAREWFHFCPNMLTVIPPIKEGRISRAARPKVGLEQIFRALLPKRVARTLSELSGVPLRTTEEWAQGLTRLDADSLVFMMASDPALRDAVVDLVESLAAHAAESAELVALLGEWNEADQMASRPMDQARLQGRSDTCGFPRPSAQADAAGIASWDGAERRREWC